MTHSSNTRPCCGAADDDVVRGPDVCVAPLLLLLGAR